MGGELLFSGGKNYKDNRVQHAVETRKIRKYPKVESPQNFAAVVVVKKNLVDRALVVLAMSIAKEEKGHIYFFPVTRC